MNLKIMATGYKRMTIDEISNEGCLNILEAFLESIGNEYKDAAMMYRLHKSVIDRDHLNKLRNYLRSEDFSALTNLDGSAIVSTLDSKYALTNMAS